MNTNRVGQVRPSQLLYTYGPGSLVDLPHMSVLVAGINYWGSNPMASPEVVEPRLLAAVRARKGMSSVKALRLPPHLVETRNPFDDWTRTGVPVSVFPSWLRCPACDRIAPHDCGLFELKTSPVRPERARFVHANCNKVRGKPPPAVPVRFLCACRGGHLDEFPWIEFAHKGQDCEGSALELFERNQSSRADDVIVKCTRCNQSRPLVDAFGESAEKSLPSCSGRYPHIRTSDNETCKERNRALLLGASNTWFSESIRVLAVPTTGSSLAQLVNELWPHLASVTSPEVLGYALGATSALRDLAAFDAAEIWDQIELRRSGVEDSSDEAEDLLSPEWAQLSNPANAIAGPDFRLRQVSTPNALSGVVERVVLCERIREVVALVGFTRIDPPGDTDASGEIAQTAPISHPDPEWVPCVEVRGEGIFIQFSEDLLADWESRVNGSPRADALWKSHRAWRERRRLEPGLGYPGLRYAAIHTFSHLLMRELALECGYGSASIRERIYARTDPEPMAGVLLYTAAPDSEGTLGGLVSLGEPDTLGRLIGQALGHGRVCASDPLCSQRLPSETEDALHGAACHACLFAPETSCERSNRYLDRTFVIDTLAETGLGVFG